MLVATLLLILMVLASICMCDAFVISDQVIGTESGVVSRRLLGYARVRGRGPLRAPPTPGYNPSTSPNIATAPPPIDVS